MTRAIRFHKTGGPDVLQIDEVETPKPAKGEVLIRMRALGLNRAEVMFREGQYVITPQFPAQLGYEGAGEIEAVGPGVTGFAVGDAVSVVPAFGFDEYGLYGEKVLAPARAVVKHPKSLSWVDAAAIWMQYVTAYGALIDIGNIQPDSVVLIAAASSSVGLAAIQVAKSRGAIPIALTRKSDKKAALLSAGATAVIATDEEDLVAEVARLTNGRGAQFIFDPVGGPTLAKLIDAAAEYGTIVLYGALSPEDGPVSALKMLGKHLTIRGYQLFEITTDDARLAKAKAFISEGIATGAFKPVVARTFPFEQIVEAHRYLESNAQVGKVVVTL